MSPRWLATKKWGIGFLAPISWRARIFAIRPCRRSSKLLSDWQDNSFVALMTWVEGEPLSEYSGMLSLLAEDLHEVSGETLALGWLRTACEALGVLHDNGLVHGDVSPRNMIVSGTDLVLTDYDCVTRVGKRATAPGTVLYCSPSYLQGHNATPADDVYALAASFFHVVFEKETVSVRRSPSQGTRAELDRSRARRIPDVDRVPGSGHRSGSGEALRQRGGRIGGLESAPIRRAPDRTHGADGSRKSRRTSRNSAPDRREARVNRAE